MYLEAMSALPSNVGVSRAEMLSEFSGLRRENLFSLDIAIAFRASGIPRLGL